MAFADLNEQGAQDAAAESKKYATNAEYQSLVTKVDMADEVAVQKMVDHVVKEFGRIDYAVNSAGVSNPQSSLCCDPGWLVVFSVLIFRSWATSPVLSLHT